MNATLLIDAIVRQTTVLIAALATASGGRAPLAHLANQVFADLVAELRHQGLGNKVIADMFGLALRTYHHRVAQLRESNTYGGHSLWEAVLEHLRQARTASRAEVLGRFHRDDEAVVRSILSDLVDSGLVFRAGRGDATTFRAASDEEIERAPSGSRADVEANLLLAVLNRHQPASREELLERLPMDEATLDRTLERLLAQDRVQRLDDTSEPRYRCAEFVVSFDDPSGWEAAVYDHYQALVTAVCTKLRLGDRRAVLSEAVGGSTFGFDVWPGHPHAERVLGMLQSIRREASALRAEVETYNRDHRAPSADDELRVIVYAGQTVLGELPND